MVHGQNQILFPVQHYDLAATLTSGQAFRWKLRDGLWQGVVGEDWVRLRSSDQGILAETAAPVWDWSCGRGWRTICRSAWTLRAFS